MKTLFAVWAAAAALAIAAPVGQAHAADLSAEDLPQIHAEYKANQARWTHEYLGKTFEATMEVHTIGNIFGNDDFDVSFMEKHSDWTPGVWCHKVTETPFLLKLNAGDRIHVSATVKDHSMGSVDLEDCQFSTEAESKVYEDKAKAGEDSWKAVQAARPDPEAPKLNGQPAIQPWPAAPLHAAPQDPSNSGLY